MRDFRSLDVWKRAFDFANEVYGITEQFPKEEVYALTSQLRRASVSIFSNIAEGCGRRTNKDIINFMYNAMGSVREVEAQLLFSGKINYLDNKKVEELEKEVIEIGRMLMGYIKYIGNLEEK